MKIHMMVGIPGCGKSTYAQTLAEILTAPLVALDEIRADLIQRSGVKEDSPGFAAVLEPDTWDIAYSRLDACLWRGNDVVWDCTNVQPDKRKFVIHYAELNRATIVAYRFTTPYAVCAERNQNRTKVVPDSVMVQMHNNFERHCSVETLMAEGFEVIEV